MTLTDVAVEGPLTRLMVWKLSPRDRTELVRTYEMAETLIHHEADIDILRRAYKFYTLFCIDQDLVDERGGRAMIANVMQAPTEMVRSSLHRVNCQLLRVLSGSLPCEHGCCCRCEGAYPNIECNSWVNIDHSDEVFS